MFVERRILATLCQPNEHQRSLAYWAWEPPVNTPASENPICRQVMQGVLVPNMHFEVCLCSSIVCPYPYLPSMDQFINHRIHEHTHITPRESRNYQRQEYVMSFKGDTGGEIEGDNEHGPTCVWGSHHSIRIEPIRCQRDTHITSLSCFVRMFVTKVRDGNVIPDLPSDSDNSRFGGARHTDPASDRKIRTLQS